MKRLWWVWAAWILANPLLAQSGGELHFCIFSEPKTFHPLLAEDVSSDTVVALTAATLLRVNRVTQKTEPELATSWKVSDGGRTIRFKLREGVRFSDGTPFSAADVAYTVEQLMDPALHQQRQSRHSSDFSHGTCSHVFRARRRSGRSFRYCGNSLPAISAERNGGSGTVLHGGTQPWRLSTAETESLLLEERLRGAPAPLS